MATFSTGEALTKTVIIKRDTFSTNEGTINGLIFDPIYTCPSGKYAQVEIIASEVVDLGALLVTNATGPLAGSGSFAVTVSAPENAVHEDGPNPSSDASRTRVQMIGSRSDTADDKITNSTFRMLEDEKIGREGAQQVVQGTGFLLIFIREYNLLP